MRTLLLLCLCLLSASIRAQHTTLMPRIRHIIEPIRAQVGVAVIFNGQDTLTVHNDSLYPMMSVFKLHQAMAVLHHLERQGLPLHTRVPIRKSQLLPDTYSPLRDKYPQGGISLPISELLTYTLQLSDNNACDILFEYIGGTAVADRYIRSLGITGFRICATEDEMHRDLTLCYQNRTSPLAAARLTEKIASDSLFSSPYQEFLRQTMLTCETGKDRLPQPLSGTQARIGHKTGTGDRNEKGEIIGFNDVGFVLLPDGTHYTIAVFIRNSSESEAVNAQVIARISEAVYQSACP